jgi:hypothetical protein
MTSQPESPEPSMNGATPEHSPPIIPEPSYVRVGHWMPLLCQFMGFGSFIFELVTNSSNSDLIVGSVSFGLGAKVVEEIRQRLK